MNINFFQVNKIATRLFLTAVLFTANSVSAANFSTIKSYNASAELPKPYYQNSLGTFFVDFKNATISVNEFTNNLNSYFGLDNLHRFELVNEKRDSKTGFTNYSYQHFYKDVKVHGDLVFIYAKEDKLNYVNGQVVNIKDLSTSSALGEEKLESIAYNDFGRTQNVKVSAVETYILKHVNEENVLIIKLVNKINLTSLNPLKSVDFVIDAQTGEIISQINKVMHADTPSSSATYFRGTKSMTVDSYNGSYRLMDNARKIRTLNGSQLDGNLNANGTFSGFSE